MRAPLARLSIRQCKALADAADDKRMQVAQSVRLQMVQPPLTTFETREKEIQSVLQTPELYTVLDVQGDGNVNWGGAGRLGTPRTDSNFVSKVRELLHLIPLS